MTIYFLLLVLSSVATVVPQTERVIYDLEDAHNLFQEFIANYGKVYETQEERDKRFLIFKQNIEHINLKNLENHATFDINHFTDLTTEEFKKMYTGARRSHKISCNLVKNVHGQAPPSLDWRKKNKVTRVKNQGHCGSCWAFATIANVESQYAIKHNELKDFSEQELVDCNGHGCCGGDERAAMQFLQEHGVMNESDYPYIGREDKCRKDKHKNNSIVSGCHAFEPKHEDELKQMLAEYGPLTLSVCSEDLQKYSKGILGRCKTCPTDHVVLLVGYGHGHKQKGDSHLTPYWIIKNSWGKSWGEEGYLLVEMYLNACSMTKHISSAIVE